MKSVIKHLNTEYCVNCEMPNITVSVKPELKEKMDKLEHINWSAVAKSAFEQEIKLQFFRELTKNSTLTEKDAKEIGDSINRAMGQRMLDEVGTRRKHPIRRTN